jgi:multicomponent Na+:H+ antiporter subunit C
MIDPVLDYYPYWFIFALSGIGLYGMMLKRNLVKKLIGMTIFQMSIILLFIVGAYKEPPATVPVRDPAWPVEDAAAYINPLPHTLMLTAIVVGVATVGLALALTILIHRRFGTLDEPELTERMK